VVKINGEGSFEEVFERIAAQIEKGLAGCGRQQHRAF
jgi:hypothetical protein